MIARWMTWQDLPLKKKRYFYPVFMKPVDSQDLRVES